MAPEALTDHSRTVSRLRETAAMLKSVVESAGYSPRPLDSDHREFLAAADLLELHDYGIFDLREEPRVRAFVEKYAGEMVL